ncbi:type II toxin-antitoxin system RelE/ParE family toxin [Aquimarina agarilytica]|uniref:type II toxin-antitoxin system RelE/ParE family toxin n=1 Tax=Aquimarina agarilytica TaxID=1087449 RepID=UPI000287F834|nr:type II toxin-antitoxin system RelE/ParE family toxin [Aquimarina agarilytica]
MGEVIKSVVWTKRASKDLEKVTKFNLKLYGADKALKIATNLRESTDILESSVINVTEYGQVDGAFLHLKYDYRKLISNHCKITYRVGRENIYIVRVFDTRQNPSKNK